MKATTKALRIAAAIALAFAATTAAAAAKKLEVKVIGSRHDGIQYWVKYTINGVEYRSDQATERVNQIAWSAMSHEDRLKTMEAVYGVGNARKAQFGEGFAANMVFWYNEVKGWNEAKEILVDRLVEKDYPGLTSRFGDNFQSYCAENFSAEHEADRYKFTELLRILAERDLALAWAQEAYKALCNAEYARVSAAVKSTSGDLIQLICDKCLVPSITLTSAGGIGILSASDSWLGIILDYSNSLLHIQDNLTDYIVGERATAKAASKVIERETEAIALNYKIIQECTKRAHELVTEFDSRYAALVAAEEERLAKINEEYKRESSERDAAVNEKSAAVVNRLNELQSVIDSADRALSQAYAALEAARKAGSDADTINSLSRKVDEKDKALKSAKASKESYVEEIRKSIESRVAAWEKNWRGIYAGFQKEANDLNDARPTLMVDKKRFDEIINGNAYGEPDDNRFVSSATEGEVATMIADIEKWLADKDEHDKKQQDAIDRFAEQERIAYWGWIPMKMDANAIDLRLDFSWPDSTSGYFPQATNDGNPTWYANASQVELLKNWSKVQDACLAQEKRLGESADAVATLAENAIENFTSASDALENFAMPDFVKEQELGGGILVLDVNSELGRAFLADDATGTAETAAGYRNRLNELADSYEEKFVRCGMLRDSVSIIGRALRSAHVSGHLTNTNKSYSAIIGKFQQSGKDVIKSSAHIGKLKALQRDFNNRSYAHDMEMDVFESLNNRRDEFSSNIIAHYSETIVEYSSLTEAAKDPYLVTAITGHGFGRDSNHWSNPYWVLWPGTFEFATASMQYSRGIGSYAYYAKDYYKKYFGDEPDPYEDFVKPLVEEIDAARAVYEAAAIGITLHIVTFDANGGSVAMAYRTVEKGAAVGELPMPTRSGWTFGGWWTAASGGTKVTAATVVSANVTYYAHWTQGGGGSDGGGTVTPDPEKPGYEVIEEKDITEPYAAPKAVTLKGVVYDGGDVAGVVELKLGKVNDRKGTSKVSGSFTGLDGKKITLKAATVENIDGTAPASVSLDVKGRGTMTVTIGDDRFAGSLGEWHVQSDAVGGDGGNPKIGVVVEANDLSKFPGSVLEALLPDGEPFAVVGGKWKFAKAASVKWAKPKKDAPLPEIYDEESGKGLIVDTSKGNNLSGLKLTYTPKKGTFKGKFTVYALEGEGKATKLKKYKVGVTGVVVGGVGYGEATCKKPAVRWTVTVE